MVSLEHHSVAILTTFCSQGVTVDVLRPGDGKTYPQKGGMEIAS